jgi:hypothetical protein
MSPPTGKKLMVNNSTLDNQQEDRSWINRIGIDLGRSALSAVWAFTSLASSNCAQQRWALFWLGIGAAQKSAGSKGLKPGLSGRDTPWSRGWGRTSPSAPDNCTIA